MYNRLQYGQFYHIYNRGINGETLFRQDENYRYFLRLFGRHIQPIAQTFAYCLMNNHFHFLLRIKTIEEQQHKTKRNFALEPSRQFNNLFIAYSKAYNKRYQRTGALFESPFRRKIVEDERYFATLVAYIHRNPQTHGFVDDFRDWPFTSYAAILSDRPSHIQTQTVLEWFGGPSGFQSLHAGAVVNQSSIQSLVEDDWL